MIASGHRQAELRALNAGEPLQTTMIYLYLPGIQGIERTLFQGHLQAAGRPVFHVAVCADRLERLEPAITLQMNNSAIAGNEHRANGTIATPANADQTIPSQLGQSALAALSDLFEVLQARILAVECQRLRRKAPLLRLIDHLSKAIIFGRPSSALLYRR